MLDRSRSAAAVKWRCESRSGVCRQAQGDQRQARGDDREAQEAAARGAFGAKPLDRDRSSPAAPDPIHCYAVWADAHACACMLATPRPHSAHWPNVRCTRCLPAAGRCRGPTEEALKRESQRVERCATAAAADTAGTCCRCAGVRPAACAERVLPESAGRVVGADGLGAACRAFWWQWM